MEDDYQKVFQNIKNVLVVVAHPDDAEMQFGGTLARLRRDRKKVRLLVCTNGSLGSRERKIDPDDLSAIRQKEQIQGAMHLGIEKNDIFMLDNKDCELTENDNHLIERIVFHMRSFRPDIVMTHEPTNYFRPLGTELNRLEHLKGKFAVNHRDHRAIAGATINATYPMARDISFFPEHSTQGLEGININKILTTNISQGEFEIDITEFIDLKNSACLAHKSQISPEALDTRNSWSTIRRGDRSYYIERFHLYDLSY